MSDANALIPISDEQAKLGQESLKVLRGLGSFLTKSLGSVPEDLVGYLGGDWLRVRRAKNIAEMMQRAKERLEARGVAETTPASLTVALPVLRGAADESRPEIQDLWARLLAAAMDPSGANRVRQRFSEAIEKMDPPDALVLASLPARSGGVTGTDRNTVAQELGISGISRDELAVSLKNLIRLELLSEMGGMGVATTPLGRDFYLRW
jgi:hypothetical protein